MIKLKSIKLRNYCGYKEFELDLSEGDGVKKWQMFYGPNGIGKSNFVRAVDFLSSPRRYTGRDNALILRKLKYNKDYIRGTESLLEKVEDLYMEGLFTTNEGERRVVIEDRVQGQLTAKNRNNPENISGVTLNELPLDLQSATLFIDADHPMNMNKFQIPVPLGEFFVDFAASVYGYECSLPEKSIVTEKGSGVDYYKDFILYKKAPGEGQVTKVHFDRFSDGERKIATLLVGLFENAYQQNGINNGIILIDNIEMHIYFKRHMTLIKKMNEYFPEHQIIATTHSPVIVKEMDSKYLCDLERKLGFTDDKEYVDLVEEDGFSKKGLEFSEAFFIMAKYGIDGPVPGYDNEDISVMGNDEGMDETDKNRLKELGWRLSDPGGCGEYMWTHKSAMY